MSDATLASVFRDVLVYVPQHDATPQRMRLRVRAGMDVDELLFQIERQLAAEAASEVARPLEATEYVVLLMREGDSALLPFSDATSEVLLSCTRVVLRRRRPPHLPIADTDERNDDEHYLHHHDDNCNSSSNVAAREVAVADASATPPCHARRGDDDDNNDDEAEEDDGHDAPREHGVTRTTRAMLYVVERLCTDFALHAATDHRPMNEEQWQTLLRYAATRARMRDSQLDEATVRAFRRAIVEPIARVQRFRHGSSNDEDTTTKKSAGNDDDKDDAYDDDDDNAAAVTSHADTAPPAS